MASAVAAQNENKFYSNAKQYWSQVPPTIEGMLGGFSFVSQTDINGSRQLLKQLLHSKSAPGRQYALDCGAGIGRISKFLLTDFFAKVDLVEQNEMFLEKAKTYLGPRALSKVGNFYGVGLQDFQPEKGKYDVIWVQWVIGHLTDEDLVDFMKSCKSGLKKNGMIVVKENVTSSGEVEVDTEDSSVTRPMGLYQELFTKAGLDCYRMMKQHKMPKCIYNVYMFALKPVHIEFCDEISNKCEESKEFCSDATEKSLDICQTEDFVLKNVPD